MAIITGDFETYYDRDYSLRKMSDVDYILDPKFQTILLSLKVDHQPTEILVGHDRVAERLRQLDWSRCAWLSHKTTFDGAILAWHYGIVPAMYLDTLSMARATTHWVLGSSSLAKLSDYLGLPPKGDEVVRAMGKRLEDFTREELSAYCAYCVRDNENCRAAFDRLRPAFSASELRLIDLVCRMFIMPQVQLDSDALKGHLADVQQKKAAVFAEVAQIDKSVFSSNQKFAALLESLGVEVPMKTSPATGEEIPALAKNDRAFKELQQNENLPLKVQAVLAARVNSKSTLEETRTQKLLDLSYRRWPAGGVGWAPVPLKYYGARPGRLSGDGGMNWQNLTRGGRIRSGIVAPPGYRIVHRDASQIEARMVAWLAGCTKLTRAFAEGRDVYSEFASVVYERPVTKADIKERFVGKTGILGLGYGCGGPRFRDTLFIGNGGISVSVDQQTALNIVYHYRNEYPEIPQLWDRCDVLLHKVLAESGSRGMGYPLRAVWELGLEPLANPGFDSLWLPNGMCIAYPNIRWERLPDGTASMLYDHHYGGYRKIYGAKCTENICQALARIIVTDIAVRLFDLTGSHPFLSTHDSLDYCVSESEAEWWDAELERQFAMRPTWAKNLPLASEGGWGPTLLAAEKMENR